MILSEKPIMPDILAESLKIAVVIPAYKVAHHILAVIADIPEFVWRIYVVDDACPNGSGELVNSQEGYENVQVLYHDENKGVGGAMLTGYKAAIADGVDIVVSYVNFLC